MDNLEERNKFIEKYNLPKLNQEEIENMNRPITSMEIEIIIKNLPTNKSQRPDCLIGKFYQKFKELIHILLKFFPKIYRRKLPNSFYKSTITLVPKPDKDLVLHTHTHTHTQRKLQANITDEQRCKNPQQNSS